MVIDTSAVVAMLFHESERERFSKRLKADAARLMSAVTRVECTCVIEGRKSAAGRRELENFLEQSEISIVPVNQQQIDLACEAFRRFGKGRHPAALNIGDCFAYALAKASGEPLLFKGKDFGRTDIVLAA